MTKVNTSFRSTISLKLRGFSAAIDDTTQLLYARVYCQKCNNFKQVNISKTTTMEVMV